MNEKRRPPLVARLATPHASSPRRWLLVAAFVIVIVILGSLGVLP